MRDDDVSLMDEVVYVFAGNDKVETISLKPTAKLSFAETFLYKQTMIINTVNKLEKDGYKLISNTGVNAGQTSNTLAYVMYLCKH